MARSRGAIDRELRQAARMQYPVEIARGREGWENWIYGFVAGVGDRWVVLQSLWQAVYVEGYEVIRLADVTDVVNDDEGGFIERAVAGLGGRPEVDFRLPAGAGAKDVLEAAAARGNFISVHFEAEEDSPRVVGLLDRLGDRKFHIRMINARGVWTTEPSGWWYGDVTSVSFGSRYEAALERFGDERPSSATHPLLSGHRTGRTG